MTTKIMDLYLVKDVNVLLAVVNCTDETHEKVLGTYISTYISGEMLFLKVYNTTSAILKNHVDGLRVNKYITVEKYPRLSLVK